jgi:hypothetical protein
VTREDAAAKARRLLAEGRLRVLGADERSAQAVCCGDSGAAYRVAAEDGRWQCSCEARGRCSHIRALALVVVLREPTA